MSFQTEIHENFDFLAAALFSELQAGEELSLNLSAEQQDYVRFNNSKVRQATSVWQNHLTLSLQHAGRKMACSVDLSGNQQDNLHMLFSLLHHARQEVRVLPEDPYLAPLQNHGQSANDSRGQVPSTDEIIACIAQHTAGTDFTGLFAAGPQLRAVRNSAGLDHWFATESFFLDYSLYTKNAAGAAKALKNLYADRVWDQQHFLQTLAQNQQHLALLQQPSLSIAPGNYRVYLAPAAVADLLNMFSWGAVSFKAWKNGACALHELVSGAKCLSEKFNLLENFHLALTPLFNSLGELPPTELNIITQGKLQNLLISTPSAKEYHVAANAADPGGWSGEYLRSPELAPGELPESQVLAQLGTGLYISNLHYLNWSDLQAARITGMTRYACFRVENGEIIAPITDLRFDDSLYHIFGSALVALTQESYVMPAVDTYQIRSLGGCKTPGALVDSLLFTL